MIELEESTQDERFPLLPQGDPRLLSPLTLAFLGDAVYELLARRMVISGGNCPVNRLHLKTVEMVKASAQSAAMGKLEEMLTPEELAVWKRGRNATSQSTPKNANIADYRRATGLESLFGYLYLKGETARLEALFAAAADIGAMPAKAEE